MTSKGAATFATTERLLILVQLLVLVSLATGLQFLYKTTGGTLFVFSTLAPMLVGLSILILGGVLFHRFRQRHRLFDVQQYEPGAVVCRQGEIGDCVYFIRSGEVEVVRETDEGETPLAKLSAGQHFGEMALLSDDPRNATVRAVAPTELAALGKANFLTMMSALPSTEHDILKTVQERAMK